MYFNNFEPNTYYLLHNMKLCKQFDDEFGLYIDNNGKRQNTIFT